jgi:hypothetical protein
MYLWSLGPRSNQSDGSKLKVGLDSELDFCWVNIQSKIIDIVNSPETQTLLMPPELPHVIRIAGFETQKAPIHGRGWTGKNECLGIAQAD